MKKIESILNSQTEKERINNLISTPLKEVAKYIKQELKKEYPNCKFSISCRHASMCSELDITLTEGDFEAILYDTEIKANNNHRSLILNKKQNHAQLNQYTFKQEYKDSTMMDADSSCYIPGYNNGVILSGITWKIFQKAWSLAKKFNWDNSDIQTDYFDVHFYLSLNIGKWDKPYINTNGGQTCIN